MFIFVKIENNNNWTDFYSNSEMGCLFCYGYLYDVCVCVHNTKGTFLYHVNPVSNLCTYFLVINRNNSRKKISKKFVTSMPKKSIYIFFLLWFGSNCYCGNHREMKNKMYLMVTKVNFKDLLFLYWILNCVTLKNYSTSA